jgi:hypothetical protein
MPKFEISPDLLRACAEVAKAASVFMAEVQSVADGFAKQLLPMLPALREGQRRMEYWDAHAPKLLREEVGMHWLIVPMSQMSFEGLAGLVTAHEQGGGPAVVVRLRQYYDEIFGSEAFLEGLERAWAAGARITRRLPLLRQALAAHRDGKYALSIPVLLAQFEGLVADVAVRPATKFMNADLRAYVERVAPGQLRWHTATNCCGGRDQDVRGRVPLEGAFAARP